MSKNVLITALTLALASAGFASTAQQPAADNTARNAQQHSSALSTAGTPLEQSETEADRHIAQRIRKVLVEDTTLSTNAKNIKIIVKDGRVTLRGPVNDKLEKSIVIAKAKQIAGAKNVDSHLQTVTY